MLKDEEHIRNLYAQYLLRAAKADEEGAKEKDLLLGIAFGYGRVLELPFKRIKLEYDKIKRDRKYELLNKNSNSYYSTTLSKSL